MLIILKIIASILANVLIMCLEWPLAKVSDLLYFHTRGPFRALWLKILLNRLFRMHLRRMNRDIIALALSTDVDMSKFLMELNRLELHYSRSL